jgi:ribosomal protein S18 acetylase RimI-like enzyme
MSAIEGNLMQSIQNIEISRSNIKGQITIRPGNPTFDEGLVCAKYMDEAAEGFFTSMLGKKAYEKIAAVYIEKNNGYSYEYVVFAELDNEIVGMWSGYTYQDKNEFDRNILHKKSKEDKMRLWFFKLIEKFLSFFLGPKSADDFYLQSLAVSKTMRGMGVGAKLMQCGFEMAIKNKSRILSLDVSSGNKKAIKLYKKIGMVEDSHWPNLPLIPSVFTRMIKNL